MTCVKTQVYCSINDENGRMVIGENFCRNPQSVCPREPGEDYTKCRTICDQAGHAEEVALATAREQGLKLDGAVAVFWGHTYACQQCQEALYDAGVRFIGRRRV